MKEVDAGIPSRREDWPRGLLDKLRQWEQGDIVQKPPLFYFAIPSIPIWAPTDQFAEDSTGPEVVWIADPEWEPPLGIVTTQTCDIGEEDSKRPKRPWVQISPVYQVTSRSLQDIAQGFVPKYLYHVPDLPYEGLWVADLRIEVPVEKTWLAAQIPIQGFANESAKRGLGQRLAWQRSRPAFSTDYWATQRNLEDAIEQLKKEEPATHKALIGVLEEIAVRVDSHIRPTYAQFVFICSAPIPQACRDWFLSWFEAVSASRSASGISLHVPAFKEIQTLTVGEYRSMTRIW